MGDVLGGWPLTTGLVFLCFVADWLAVGFHLEKVKPFTKALAMFSVIIWTVVAVQLQLGGWIVLVLFGQLFGLVGDVFLLLPNRFFIWGLISFLVGHCYYLSAMGVNILDQSLFHALHPGRSVYLVIMAFILGGFIVLFYSVLRPAINDRLSNKILQLATGFYSWLLILMAGVSLFTALQFPDFSWHYLFLPLGGFLFLASDSLLVYERFVNRVYRRRLWVRIMYHLAQFSIALGFLVIMSV